MIPNHTLHIGSCFQPKFAGNDFSQTEKNWVLFERDGSLFCIYKCDPTHQVFEINGEEIGKLHETPGPRWPYGAIRGGTPPLEHDGELLRFFHSSLFNDLPPNRHRYYIGAYLMNPEPPFKVVAVSKKPILYGSEISDLRGEAKKACDFYKPNVVFVSGAIKSGDGWVISVGTNDCGIVLSKVGIDDLNL